MATLLIGFDQILPGQDATRILEALLPRNEPSSYLVWPAKPRTASVRSHRKTVSRSGSGWDSVWEQFIAEWTSRRSGEPSPADLSSFLNDLPKLLSSCYSNVVIFGPAPRSALSTACVRALRIALLSLKKARMIWVDLSPHSAKAATLSFSRTLLHSNSALINPNLVEPHLMFFRPDTLGVAPPNTLNIFKSSIVLPDGSQISVRAYNIKSKVEVRFAVDARDCRRALITADEELSSSACWISLRKRHLDLSHLGPNGVAFIIQFDSIWGLLFPFTDLIFIVFNISVEVYESIISKIDRIEFPITARASKSDASSFRGEMLSGPVSAGCDFLVEADYLTVERARDGVSRRLEALRQARKQEPDKEVPRTHMHSPIGALSTFFRHIIRETKVIDDVPQRIREIAMMQCSVLEKKENQVSAAENLEKAITDLRPEGLADSIVAVQLKMVASLEIALLLDSEDPVNRETLTSLQNNAATLSVMFAGSGSAGLETFLESTLVKFYGGRFPLTLLELYDHLDLHPPFMITRPEDDESSQTLVLPESETFTDAATSGLPESPSSSSKSFVLAKQSSTLLELIAQESSKRRRTVSCFSSRLENTVKWSRSFSDRDPKRRRSDSSFLLLSETKSSSAGSLHVLVEASPARTSATPQRKPRLESGPVISESPLSLSFPGAISSDIQKGVSLGSPPVKRILSFDNC